MMNARIAGSAVLLSILCLGAGPFSFSGLSKKELAERVEILEKQNAELRTQVSDLSRKVGLLAQKVNMACLKDAGARTLAGPASKEIPDLEVVRISPEGLARERERIKPRGKLIVAHSDGESMSLIEHGAPLPGTDYVPLPDPAGTVSRKGGAEAGARVPAMARPEKGAENQAGQEESSASFENIRELVDKGEQARAAPFMQKYLEENPGGPKEDMVAFWMGQHLFNEGDYKRAIEYYRIVTERHVESDSAPEALYKTGLCWLELERTEEAADALREVKILYPFSQAAKQAEDKLLSCCR